MVSRSATRVSAVIRKELAEFRRNRLIIVTASILPVIFLVEPTVNILTLKASASSATLDKRVELSLFLPLLVPALLTLIALVNLTLLLAALRTWQVYLQLREPDRMARPRRYGRRPGRPGRDHGRGRPVTGGSRPSGDAKKTPEVIDVARLLVRSVRSATCESTSSAPGDSPLRSDKINRVFGAKPHAQPMLASRAWSDLLRRRERDEHRDDSRAA